MQRETQKSHPGDRAGVRVICFLIGFITILLYWPVQNYQFNDFDDAQYLTQNPHIQNGLTLQSVAWAFTTGYAGNWHPLTWLSHMGDVQVFGLNAGGHHFTNLLIHVANAILLFLILRCWTGSIWRPAFVAALFAWHPMHVESVAWVAERKDVLSAFFWLLTMLAYGEYVKSTRRSASPVQTKPWGAKRPYLLTLFLFTLGLLSKPMVVSLPLILLLVDYWPLRRIGFPFAFKEVTPLILEKFPLFLLTAASCFITFLAQKKSGAVQSLQNLTLYDRLGNAIVSYARYLGKLFWPIDMAVLYPFTRRLPLAEVFMAGLLLLLITTLAVRLAKKSPPLIVGWLWFLIALIPVIGLVQVGEQAMADRFTYIPSIGLFVMVAWAPSLFASSARNFELVTSALSALVLAACVLAARHQLAFWRDSITLFTHAIQVAPNNVIAECDLGLALAEQGHIEEAVAHERKAIQINPSYLAAQNNLGILLEQEGKWDEAAAPLLAALKIDSNYDEAYYNLGAISLHEGRLDEAVARFRKAVSLNPQYDKAMANLGMALAQQGHLDEAMAEYRRALELAPNNAYAHNALGRALETRNRLDEAAAQYSAAVALKPDFADAHENLGVVLGLLGHFQESEAQFAQALQLQPASASIHFNLGNALLRQNKLQGAATQYSVTLRLQPENHQARANLDLVLTKLGQNQPHP
jgi:tetratricopeptide (TPR) repeat protein